MSRPRAMFPFLGLAIAFIGLGVATNRVFLYVGIAFLIIALATVFARRR